MPEWALRQEVRIGDEGAPEYALTEFGELAVGPDGAMFVPQLADASIRVFDRDGTYLRSIGRRGEGPGEFAALLRMGIRGDSLWVSDRSRLTWFSLDGSYLGSESTTYDPQGPRFAPGPVLQVMADGTFATVPIFMPSVDRDTWPTGVPVQRYDTTGAILAVMGVFDPSPIRLFLGPGDRPLLAMLPFQPLFLHAFDPAGRWVVVLDEAAATSDAPSTFRFFRIGPDGDTLAARDIRYTPVAVPETVHDSLIAALSEGATPRDLVSARLRAAPIPGFYPPITRIVVADDGSAWLELQGHSPPRWLVVDSTGTPIAHVVGDPSLRLMVIRNDEAWGSVRNELDVPFVVRYRIQR